LASRASCSAISLWEPVVIGQLSLPQLLTVSTKVSHTLFEAELP
jgi:hypothetical protein